MKEKLLIIETMFMKNELVDKAFAQIIGENTVVTVESKHGVTFEARYSESNKGYSLVDTITWDEYTGDDLNKLIQDCYKETKYNDEWYKRVCDKQKTEDSLAGDM